MSLTVRYFAALRERMGMAEETVTAPAATGQQLIDWLIERDALAEILAHPSTRIIVNDEIVPRVHALKPGDTVAFCPPFPEVRVSVTVRVQTARFDAGALLNALSGCDSDCGAVASFSGQVRWGHGLLALELEHYPGVTETALERIARHAVSRWDLRQATIIHRTGRMEIGEEIVFVGATAPHRRAALDAVSFMIDVLKTQAPFWKKEYDEQGERWVEARASDDEAAARWLTQTEDMPA